MNPPPLPGLDLADFLSALFRHGEVDVPPGPDALAATPRARRVLADAYSADAWHFPGEQAPWDPAAAEIAACWFAAAAMCYADRSMHAEATRRLLAAPLAPKSPAAHYSADLVLRFLPSLLDLAAGAAEDDPAVHAMQRMAFEWPLASPGIDLPADFGEPDLETVLAHAGLRRLYLDRLIARADTIKLQNPAVRSACRNSLGDYPDLIPALSPCWRSDVHNTEIVTFSHAKSESH